ncbi:MAG: response regulator [Candidatus Auribacterota bacterium]|nr:response regulator [Candidatus Auribacterota bacterium]
MNILVIEDEEALSELLGYILSDEGYEVTIARDYDEALDMLDIAQYNLIMADMTIPGGNGIDLIDHARGSHPLAQYIVMSGYELNEEQKTRVDEMSCYFLSKPFRIDEVSEIIRNIINSLKKINNC